MSRFSGSKTALYARTYGNYPNEKDIGCSEPHTSNIYKFHYEEGRISNYLIQDRVKRNIIGSQELFHIYTSRIILPEIDGITLLKKSLDAR